MNNMTTREKRIRKFVDDFKNEKLTKKYLCKEWSVSGCQTQVYPIIAYENSIDIQWNSDKHLFDKFIKRIVNKNSDLIKFGYHVVTDKSCPSVITFYLKEE